MNESELKDRIAAALKPIVQEVLPQVEQEDSDLASLFKEGFLTQGEFLHKTLSLFGQSLSWSDFNF